MDLRAANPIEEPPPSPAGAKFAYPGGSKPLEGFTLKRGIGRGGFGEVYYAVSDAGKEVALKLIRRNMEIELRGVTQCLNLKHQNLLAIFDIRRDAQDDAWIVMEYVSGESLSELLERSPRGLTIEETRHWLRGILAAVAHLHDHGIVHRDLKPGNIFRDQGVVKLGDYGLSKFISCSRRSGHTESVGTVHYMAPEIANGRYSKEIDLYALGIIVYEMLTGRVPFEGESMGEVLMKHLTALPDVSTLPEPFRTAVGQALSKDPAARAKSVAEFARQLQIPLEDTASSEPAKAPPAPHPAAPPVPPAQPFALPLPTPSPGLDEEPLWRAIRQAYGQLRDAWVAADYGPVTKIVLIVLVLLVLAGTAGFWIFGVLAGLLLYGAYRLVRAFMLLNATSKPKPIYTAPPPVLAYNQPPPVPPAGYGAMPYATAQPQARKQHAYREQWSQAPWKNGPGMAVLQERSTRTRVRELLGSLLLSAAVAAIVVVPMQFFRLSQQAAEQLVTVQYAWLAVVGTLGAWAVLTAGKFWEKNGEPLMRRLAMFTAGMGVGLIAYLLQSFLQIQSQDVILPYEMRAGGGRFAFQQTFYHANGAPGLLPYVMYFGFMLALPSWWKQVHPLRTSRLKIWNVMKVAFMAWLVSLLLPFPQPWGFCVAATISIAAQISAAWYPKIGTAAAG